MTATLACIMSLLYPRRFPALFRKEIGLMSSTESWWVILCMLAAVRRAYWAIGEPLCLANWHLLLVSSYAALVGAICCTVTDHGRFARMNRLDYSANACHAATGLS